MTRVISYLSVLFFLAIPSGAFADEADNNALLWRISGNGISQPSYLFGTVHLICADDFLWNDSMNLALQASKKVCFELDLDDPALYDELASGLADTKSLSVKDQLNEAQYARLKRYFRDSLHVELSMVEKLGVTTLSTLLLSRLLPCNTPLSYEQKIMEQAQKSNMEVIGLEAVSEQVSVLDSMVSDSGAIELLELIDSLPAYRAQYVQMISSYKQQNLNAVCEWVKSADMPWEPLDMLLDDRNQKWIPRMKKIMSGTPVFFAVGAAHLCGPKGVIALLREAGYKVTPVR